MRISDILQNKGSGVVVMPPQEPVRQLVELLRQHNLGAVVVSASDRTIDGIVSERDVVRRLAGGTDVLDLPVSEIMTAAAGVQTCRLDDQIEHLMELMTQRRVRHVPVVDDDDRLAGVVSIGDVVKSRISELRYERDELERYVAG
jgi:CBS domain-containing protein